MDETTRTKRLNETDRLAMIMCEECGLDPHRTVQCRIGDDYTPYDSGWAAWPYCHPNLSPVSMTVNGNTFSLKQATIDYTSLSQWRLFRPHAFQALAYQRAFDKYMLTEA